MVFFEFQKTLEKNYQSPGEISATFSQEDGRIYELQLVPEMGSKYRFYGCYYTRNKERSYRRGRGLD
jgi:hypothetical protein